MGGAARGQEDRRLHKELRARRADASPFRTHPRYQSDKITVMRQAPSSAGQKPEDLITGTMSTLQAVFFLA